MSIAYRTKGAGISNEYDLFSAFLEEIYVWLVFITYVFLIFEINEKSKDIWSSVNNTGREN